MTHSRRHVQSHRSMDFGRAKRVHQPLVVIHRRSRRDVGIAPSVIDHELCAAIDELLDVWRGGAHYAAVGPSRLLQVLRDIERAEIPVRILEDHVLEEIIGHAQWLRAPGIHRPARFTAWLDSRKHLFASTRVHNGRIDRLGGSDLRSGRYVDAVAQLYDDDGRPQQAVWTVCTGARRHRRVELASHRIADQSVE